RRRTARARRRRLRHLAGGRGISDGMGRRGLRRRRPRGGRRAAARAAGRGEGAMSAPRVAVLDYGSGNIHSAVRAPERTGASVVLTADPAEIEAADGLVVPGVGAFASGMEGLAAVDGVELLRDRHARGRPTLGICVGPQVLFAAGSEHGGRTGGAAPWPGEVPRPHSCAVPHTRWPRLRAAPGPRLCAGLEDEAFYVVDSYAAPAGPPGALASTAVHGGPFAAAVEDGATSATQFLPEKSGDAGAALLANWVRTLHT